jgi:hypothetical protein
VGAFTLGLRHYVFQAVCLRRRLFRGRPGHTEPGSPIVRWASPVKLWEDDKFFVKSFTATSYLPRLLVRSSSCSILFLFGAGACVSVLACRCLRVGPLLVRCWCFGGLKRFNELLDVVRWPWFLQEVAVCFVPRGCTSRYCTFFLHIDASTGIIPKLSF